MNPNSPTKAPALSSGVILALTLVYVVWGSTYLAIRYAVVTIPPFMMAAMRFLSAGVLMYGWLRARGVANPTARQWRSITVIAVFLLCGGNAGVAWAERVASSGLAALLVSVVPLWMTLFEWIGPRGRRPSVLTWIGVIMGLAGIVVLIGVDNVSAPQAWNPALIALIVAPILWAIGSVLSKRLALPASPFMATATQMMVGGALLLGMSALTGEWRGFHFAQVSAVSWWGLIFLTLIGAIVGFTAYVWLLHNAPLPLVSTYAYVNPVVAVILGWLIAGEIITTQTLVGGGVVLLSVVLITLGSRESRPREQSPR